MNKIFLNKIISYNIYIIIKIQVYYDKNRLQQKIFSTTIYCIYLLKIRLYFTYEQLHIDINKFYELNKFKKIILTIFDKIFLTKFFFITKTKVFIKLKKDDVT